ncbi:MAG: carboxypeptidase regulatory-like domain-containing protein [Acidobacteriaceae bacterium]
MIFTGKARFSAPALARRVVLGILCLCVPFMLVSAVFAQADQGAITGVVTDSSGSAIPHAQVSLTDTDTGLELQTRSNGDGLYTFSPVKIGNYKIAAAAPGFATVVQEHLHLNVQQRLNVPLSLRPGTVNQTVTVSSAPPALQTQDASLGQVMSTQTINDTPLNGRNWVFIAQLSAGVDPGNGSRGSGSGDFSANGEREEQNDFILDGVDNNTDTEDFLNGASFVVRPPPDALAEFKVQTSDYSAEFGHSAGAVVNASIKSGTNSIHGDLWEYFRNDALDARDYFATTVPEYRENQFGGTLGFPIIRNKLFFFADTEANRIVQGSPTTFSVPTALERQGNFSELLNPSLNGTGIPIQLYQPGSAGGPGGTATLSCNGQNNVLCASQIDKAGQAILNMYPMPNANNGAVYNNYVVNLNTTNNTFQWDTRVDWDLSSRDQAFARFSYSNQHQYSPSPLGPILDGDYGDGNDANIGENFAGSETHSFSPTLINEFRIGYNYGNFTEKQFNSNQDVSSTLGLGGIPFSPNLGGLVNVSINGISGFGTPYYYPTLENEHVLEILDNVTKIMGNHALRFGVDFQRINTAELQPVIATGAYNFTGEYTSIPGVANTGSGVADFLANQMNSATLGIANNTNDHRWLRSAYGQDDWRVTRRLTINLGLRYDYFGPKSEDNGNQANFYASGPLGFGTGAGVFELPTSQQNVLPQSFTSILAANNVTVAYSNNPSLVTSQKYNLAPRLGAAWTVNPHTVVRAGYGVFYGGMEGFGYGVNLSQNVPFNFTSGIPSTTCTVAGCPTNGISLNTGFTQAVQQGAINSISYPTVTAIARNAQTPFSQEYNLSTEYAITPTITATLGYVGGNTHHLYVEYPSLNSTLALSYPGDNTRNYEPFPTLGGINYEQAIGTSSYNSLQAKLEKRYANGMSFLASYTWAHSLDNAQSDLADNQDYGYRAPGILPISDEMRNSAFDVRHRFTFDGTYALPFGVGRRYLSHPGVGNQIAGGWSGTLVFQGQTGNPFSLYSDNSTANGLDNAPPLVKANPRAGGGNPSLNNGLPAGYTCPSSVGTPKQWYNPCAFANPRLGSDIVAPGTTPTGSQIVGPVTDPATVLQFAGGPLLSVYGPPLRQFNMSIFKNFTTWHEQSLQFRTDIFNVLNTPWFAVPSYSNDGAYGGQITSTRETGSFTPDPRFFQFAMKYQF